MPESTDAGSTFYRDNANRPADPLPSTAWPEAAPPVVAEVVETPAPVVTEPEV